MSARPIIPVVPIVVGDRHCNTCNSSWNLPPTSSEIKDGFVDGHLYCCNKQVHMELNDEIFPRLCDVARSDPKLCGPRGRHWTPVVEPITYDPRPAYVQRRVQVMSRQFQQTAEGKPDDNKKKPKPPTQPRKPYKV